MRALRGAWRLSRRWSGASAGASCGCTHSHASSALPDVLCARRRRLACCAGGHRGRDDKHVCGQAGAGGWPFAQAAGQLAARALGALGSPGWATCRLAQLCLPRLPACPPAPPWSPPCKQQVQRVAVGNIRDLRTVGGVEKIGDVPVRDLAKSIKGLQNGRRAGCGGRAALARACRRRTASPLARRCHCRTAAVPGAGLQASPLPPHPARRPADPPAGSPASGSARMPPLTGSGAT